MTSKENTPKLFNEKRAQLTLFFACLFFLLLSCDFNKLVLAQEHEGQIYNLSEFDLNQDGLLEITGVINSGDVIFRDEDGVTQIEPGQYIVPNNIFFADHDENGVIDPEPTRAKLVIVIGDNLTYLFEENSNNLLAVFPNGSGRGGANTVASVRVIDAFLGEKWGETYSELLGFETNAYGVVTLDTSFYISAMQKVPSAQEVHGSPPEWEFLLGTEISAGCSRHLNRDIIVIRNHMRLNDFVLTLETARDDEVDNPFNIYNHTRTASNLVTLPEITDQNIRETYTLIPSNDYNPLTTLESEWSQTRWLTLDQLNQPLPFGRIAHPYTRANYRIIPCGLENIFIQQQLTNFQSLIPVQGGYQLNTSPTVMLPDGSQLLTSTFYLPIIATSELINQQLFLYSEGELIPYFQHLVANYAYQYAVYVSARDNQNFDLLNSDEATQARAVSNLSNVQLREIQLVTGLIPGRYNWSSQSLEESTGKYTDALESRTLLHSMMNIFYGSPGIVYELDFRDGMAYLVQNLLMNMPSPDHEMIRVLPSSPLILNDLIGEALQENRSIIFRISGYAALTTPLRYELGLSRAHYYSLVPHFTNLEEGVIAIYDTMHPSQILQIRTEYIDDIFTTVTISPPND